MGNIIPVYDIAELGNVLSSYNETIDAMSANLNKNNRRFNDELKTLVEELCGEA